MRILKSHSLGSLINNYLIDSPELSNINLLNFGSLLGFCLVTQIITGVTLAMHYNPSTLEAFNSVEHINNGWLIRCLYIYAVLIFILPYLFSKINIIIRKEHPILGIIISMIIIWILIRNFSIITSTTTYETIYSISGQNSVYFYFFCSTIYTICALFIIHILLTKVNSTYDLLFLSLVAIVLIMIALFITFHITSHTNLLNIHDILGYFKSDIISYINRPPLVVLDPNNQLAIGYVVGGTNQPLAGNIATALSTHQNTQLTGVMLSPQLQNFLESHFYHNIPEYYDKLTFNTYVDQRHWWSIGNTKLLRNSLWNLP